MNNIFADTDFAGRIERDVPLSRYTTLGVGGNAEYFFPAPSTDDLVKVLTIARQRKTEVTLLGAGSNVLVNDAGVRGLVIQNRSTRWEILSDETTPTRAQTQNLAARWHEVEASGVATEVYDESKYPTIHVRVDSGCIVQRLMAELLEVEVTGLEWFSGIPATVGGAVYMNMHGAHKFFGDVVVSARILQDGEIRAVPHEYFKFVYDWSVLHETGEAVIDVTLALRRGPVAEAKKLMQDWMIHKNKTQPKKSCGSVFRNISPEEQARLHLPTNSAGYIIDKVLDLNGMQIGGARIYDTNGNFMVNTGNARAEDFAILIAYVKERARNKLGLDLHEEVLYLGYT